MDNESDTFGDDKILHTMPRDYAIDYPFMAAANNSSTDFAQVTTFSRTVLIWLDVKMLRHETKSMR